MLREPQTSFALGAPKMLCHDACGADEGSWALWSANRQYLDTPMKVTNGLSEAGLNNNLNGISPCLPFLGTRQISKFQGVLEMQTDRNLVILGVL